MILLGGLKVSEEIDPELSGLLNEIEDAEGDASKAQLEEDIDDPQKTEMEKDAEASASLEIDAEENDIDDFNSLEDDFEEDGNDDFEAQVEYEAEVVEVDQEKERIEKNIIGLLDQHCDSAKAMFEEAEVDRRRIDDVVAILLPKIEGDDYRGSDIMALANLIQTKADISKNRASNMDSIAKLFAALKNNDRIAPNAGGSGDDDLSNEEIAVLLGKRDA